MEIKKILAIVGGGLAVVSLITGGNAVLLAVGIIVLAVAIIV